MLFNSYLYIIFFAAVLCVVSLSGSWTFRKAFLLGASYFFYAAWNPAFLFLLVGSTVVDWFIAKWIHSTESSRYRRILLGGSLLFNLGLLGFFKYGMFIMENALTVIGWTSIQTDLVVPSIVLPVGISFYTFQTLSYTLDIFYRRIEPGKSILDYALFVTFFPQLVAGPIVRAAEFLPQCAVEQRATQREIIWGIALIVMGLFNKLVVADSLMAGAVEAVYNVDFPPTAAEGWVSTIAFSLQVFADFAGYSSCAIGTALCLGFKLPDNFRYPHAAIGFSDYWRRWHISLSTWLRDYVYFPLGGSRLGPTRTQVNLMITMLIGGLWHGASWNFVIWGGMHGVLLLFERKIRKTCVCEWPIWQITSSKVIIALLTFAMVTLTRVFFRSPSFERSGALVGGMFGFGPEAGFDLLTSLEYFQVLATLVVIFSIHYYMRERSVENVWGSWPPWFRACVIAVMSVFIALSLQEGDRAFIYFQF